MVKDMTKKDSRGGARRRNVHPSKLLQRFSSAKKSIAGEINDNIDTIDTLRINNEAEILLSIEELSYIRNLLDKAISYMRGGEFLLKMRHIPKIEKNQEQAPWDDKVEEVIEQNGEQKDN